ncbi:MAG: F0F1 ATP synthase subunit [Bacteroidetes bacterium]|nr:MAG: F0F1 ATP synthase subunit [Bacteroidota bacterium]PTM13519.1 MAG: F0F1 ATP synthase subunit [Bacteroidota bacterium]
MMGNNQPKQPNLGKQVGDREALKLRARKKGKRSPLYGLGLFGLVGWSVVVPTLVGAALGRWIDTHYPSTHAWTLNLLIIGLVTGCLNAWFWIQKENHEIDKDLADDSE